MEEGMPLLTCPKCGKENAEDTKYCQGCGAKIKWIYADRKCTHCGGEWTPRTADPKTCPNCGYRLSKDNEVEIFVPLQVVDEGSMGMTETKCSVCGKRTSKYALFKLTKKDSWRDVCYACLVDYFKWRDGKGDDIIEGSFRTTGIERLEDGTDRLIKE